VRKRSKESGSRWGIAHRFEKLSIHGDGEFAPQSCGQSFKYVGGIEKSDMVRDDQNRSIHTAQIFATADARPSEKQHRRASEKLENQGANRAYGPALRPA